MKRSLVLAAALAAALPFSALAHKAWLQPSQTVIAGDHPWITVDAAVSNDLFYFNHVPLRLESLVITAPDGTTVQPQNASTGKFRSVFDVELTQQGTYRLASVNNGLSASWEEDGKPKRWRGTVATFATEVPKKAKKLQVSQSVNRIETFVTLGAPSLTALAPTGEGIELVPVSHPNDLVSGEAATFQLVRDGQPAAGLEVTIARGGTRYRDNPEEMTVTTGADGSFTVTWPEPGMYWMNASVRTAATGDQMASSAQYNGVVEVLP